MSGKRTEIIYLAQYLAKVAIPNISTINLSDSIYVSSNLCHFFLNCFYLKETIQKPYHSYWINETRIQLLNLQGFLKVSIIMSIFGFSTLKKVEQC